MSYPTLADFWDWYNCGLQLWQGQYTSVYPLPMMGWFALYTLLPGWLSGTLVTLTSLAILVALTRWRAFLWLTYTPFVHLFTIGQIDMLFLGLYTIGSPVALALMTLKPQLLVLALPKLLRFDHAQRKQFALWVLALYGPITLVRPTWVFEWYQNIASIRLAAVSTAGVWSQPVLLLLMLVPFAVARWRQRRLNYYGALLTLHPAILPYDYCFLIGHSLWLIPLSWLIWVWWRNVYVLQVDITYMWSVLGIAAILTDPPPKTNLPFE